MSTIGELAGLSTEEQEALAWLGKEVAQSASNIKNIGEIPAASDFKSLGILPSEIKKRLEALPPEERKTVLQKTWKEGADAKTNLSNLKTSLDEKEEPTKKEEPTPPDTAPIDFGTSVPSLQKDPTIGKGLESTFRRAGPIRDIPVTPDMSNKVSRILNKNTASERVREIESAAVSMHGKMFGAMYASPEVRKGMTDESMLQRQALIDVIASKTEDPDSTRKALARKTDAEIQQSLLSLGEDKVREQVMRDPGMAGAPESRVQEAMAPILKKQAADINRQAYEQSSIMRRTMENVLVSQDETGKLAKDVQQARDKASGIREANAESKADLVKLDKRLSSTQNVSEQDRQNIHTAFYLGGRYGFNAEQLENPADAKKMVRSMAFAELTAGKLTGKEREQYLKQAAGRSEEEQTRILKSKGLDKDGIMDEAVEEIQRAGKAAEKAGKTSEAAERFTEKAEGLKGISELASMQQAAGLNVEVDEELAKPDIPKGKAREEIATETASRVEGIASRAVAPPPEKPKVKQIQTPSVDKGGQSQTPPTPPEKPAEGKTEQSKQDSPVEPSKLSKADAPVDDKEETVTEERFRKGESSTSPAEAREMSTLLAEKVFKASSPAPVSTMVNKVASDTKEDKQTRSIEEKVSKLESEVIALRDAFESTVRKDDISPS